jgi:hypothetical protein
MKPIYKIVVAAWLQLGFIYMLSAQADLRLFATQPVYADVFVNSNLQFSFDVYNQGDQAAVGDFLIQFALSTDDIWSPDDYQNGNVLSGNIAAGQAQLAVEGNMTIGNLPDTYYYLLLHVDANAQITESDETNNIVIAGYFRVLSAATPNFTAQINAAWWSNTNVFNAVVQINNASAGLVTDSTWALVYAGNSGATIQKIRVPPLAAWASFSAPVSSIRTPQELLNSPFSIGLLADSEANVTETDEADNVAFGEINIPAGITLPDYELTLEQPIPSPGGDSVPVTFAVRNVGSGITPAAGITFTLHNDSALYWLNSYPLGTYAFGALNAGQIYNGAVTLSLPPLMKTGTYRIKATAGDDLYPINNQTVVTITINNAFVQPERIMLGAGEALALRQNADLSYTVLVKTPTNKARAVVVNAQGDIISNAETGPLGEQTTFAGPGALVRVQRDSVGFYLVKMTEQGDLIWSQWLPTPNNETPQCVTYTADGGFLVGGYQNLPGPTGPGSQLPFLLRTDANGNELWRRTEGPAAAAITRLTQLPNGDFGAVLNYYGYTDQIFGFDIRRISADGHTYTYVDGLTSDYQGTFSMFATSLKAGFQDSALLYSMNRWEYGKWSTYYQSFYKKNQAWAISEMACGGICVPQGTTASSVAVPVADGGGLALGENSSAYHAYYSTRLDALGNVLWRKPYPAGAVDGIQSTGGDFAICGNMAGIAYLTLLRANGEPTDNNACLTDIEPPILTNCPQNTVVETINSTEYIAWVPPGAADNCAVVSVSSNLQPGYMSVGIHTVVFTATDAAGNTTTCQFTTEIVQVPCLPGFSYAFCDDHQTPGFPADDSLTVNFNLISPDTVGWTALLQDWPGAAPINGIFNQSYSFQYRMSDISPYLFDGQLTFQIVGQSGNLCDQTITFSFDTSDYCYNLLSYTDVEVSNLVVDEPIVAAGSTLPLRLDVRNAGNAPTENGWELGYYLSADTLISPDDWFVERPFNATLPAGGALLQYPDSIAIPLNTSPGDWYVLVKGDPRNLIAEPNENNNLVWGKVNITAPASGTNAPVAADYRVQPNPFVHQFWVRCPATSVGKELNIRLYNGSGALVYGTVSVAREQVPITPEYLPAGLYIVEISDEEQIFRKRVFKN